MVFGPTVVSALGQDPGTTGFGSVPTLAPGLVEGLGSCISNFDLANSRFRSEWDPRDAFNASKCCHDRVSVHHLDGGLDAGFLPIAYCGIWAGSGRLNMACLFAGPFQIRANKLRGNCLQIPPTI